MGRYVPVYSDADDSPRPSKRLQIETDDLTDIGSQNYRTRTPPSERRGGNQNRSHTNWARNRSHDTYKSSNGRYQQRRRSASPGRDGTVGSVSQPRNKKSRRDRKENPSTRIHSLRKLLDRGGLPANVQQDKERELAALLFDQQKAAVQKDAKKNLKRYHFIRFVERQKATRILKQLRKRQESGDVSEELEQQIHVAEVDLNYTQYAPLAQKYIAIYARDDTADGKPRPLPRNLSKMRRSDYEVLSSEQQSEIEQLSAEAANVVQLANSAQGEKPPMWHVVEATMKEGRKHLENLRNEQTKTSELTSNLAAGKAMEKKPDWLEDGGEINPEDLDSDSDEGDDGARMDTAIDNDDVEDHSDGDGGFFEKR